jgi:hypothetical protein
MTLDWTLSQRPNQLRVLCLQLPSLRTGGDYGPKRTFISCCNAACGRQWDHVSLDPTAILFWPNLPLQRKGGVRTLMVLIRKLLVSFQ